MPVPVVAERVEGVEGEVRVSRRRARFGLREGLWRVSEQRRLRACGKGRISRDKPVEGRRQDGVGHLTNVAVCGSIHACPVCSAKIRALRATEIEQAMVPWLAAGHGAEFVTCTLPHGPSDRLAPLLVAVRESWTAVTSGAVWGSKRSPGLRDLLGVAGQIRTLEVTRTANGWHPHVHVLVLTEVPLEDWQRAMLHEHVANVWAASIVRHGLRRPSEAHGVTVTPVRDAVDVSRYTAKVEDESGRARALGNELVRHDLKVGRRPDSRTPFEVLASAAEDGDAGDLVLWREFEAAIKGQRAIVWSNGLKGRFLVPEVSDKEAAEGPAIGGETVVVLTEAQRKAVVRSPGAIVGLLEAIERGPGPAEAFLIGVTARYESRRWSRWRPAGRAGPE